MSVPKQRSVWDERRNTSRVRPVPPNALPEALQVLANFRRHFPAHAQWVEEGAPRLSHEDHLRRFGVPYTGVRAKRA